MLSILFLIESSFGTLFCSLELGDQGALILLVFYCVNWTEGMESETVWNVILDFQGTAPLALIFMQVLKFI